MGIISVLLAKKTNWLLVFPKVRRVIRWITSKMTKQKQRVAKMKSRKVFFFFFSSVPWWKNVYQSAKTESLLVFVESKKNWEYGGQAACRCLTLEWRELPGLVGVTSLLLAVSSNLGLVVRTTLLRRDRRPRVAWCWWCDWHADDDSSNWHDLRSGNRRLAASVSTTCKSSVQDPRGRCRDERGQWLSLPCQQLNRLLYHVR